MRKIKFNLPKVLQKFVSESQSVCVCTEPQEKQTILMKYHGGKNNLFALYKHLRLAKTCERREGSAVLATLLPLLAPVLEPRTRRQPVALNITSAHALTGALLKSLNTGSERSPRGAGTFAQPPSLLPSSAAAPPAPRRAGAAAPSAPRRPGSAPTQARCPARVSKAGPRAGSHTAAPQRFAGRRHAAPHRRHDTGLADHLTCLEVETIWTQ